MKSRKIFSIPQITKRAFGYGKFKKLSKNRGIFHNPGYDLVQKVMENKEVFTNFHNQMTILEKGVWNFLKHTNKKAVSK